MLSGGQILRKYFLHWRTWKEKNVKMNNFYCLKFQKYKAYLPIQMYKKSILSKIRVKISPSCYSLRKKSRNSGPLFVRLLWSRAEIRYCYTGILYRWFRALYPLHIHGFFLRVLTDCQLVINLKHPYPTRWCPLITDGGHLGWTSGQTNTILNGDHPRTIPSKFGPNWPSSFRREDFLLFFP